MVMMATVAAYLKLCTKCYEHGHATIVLANGKLTMEFRSKQAGHIICETLFETKKLSEEEQIAIDREIDGSPLSESLIPGEMVSLSAQAKVSIMSAEPLLLAIVIVEDQVHA